MAGLLTSWKAPDESRLESYTIITTESDKLIGNVHDRMPVILAEEGEGPGLDSKLTEPANLVELLKL